MTRVVSAQRGTFAQSPRQDVFSAGDFCDRYQLVHRVAQGGMGDVWLARLRGRHGFERFVAIKTILPVFAEDPRFWAMFLDEARIASRIEHTNVAQIFDLGERDGRPYLVMEWIDGDSLAQLAQVADRASGGFPLPVLLRILADACAGLHSAHELKDPQGHALEVVHRDVSPQNILVSRTGTVKVIDFGVAKARVRLAEETSAGTVKGKLHYTAPERALGVPADRRSDIWAIGAVLYRILAGRHAYRGVDDHEVVRQLVSGAPPDPLPPAVPPSVRNLVARALAPDPRQRFATAAELQRALECALEELSAVSAAKQVTEFLAASTGISSRLRRSEINAALERLDREAASGQELDIAWEDDAITFQLSLPRAVSRTLAAVQPVATPQMSAEPEARRSHPTRSLSRASTRSTATTFVHRSLTKLGAVGLGALGVTVLVWRLSSVGAAFATRSPSASIPSINAARPALDEAFGTAASHAPCCAIPSVNVTDLALEVPDSASSRHRSEKGKKWPPRASLPQASPKKTAVSAGLVRVTAATTIKSAPINDGF